MAKRRTLVTGINSTPKADPQKEAAFVYNKTKPATKKPKAAEEPVPELLPPEPIPAADQPVNRPVGRMPLTTRIRTDLATGLKRASLERQLSGQKPNSVQDILEAALEPWLKEHGYLK